METVNYKECVERLVKTINKQEEFDIFNYSTMLAVIFDKHKKETIFDLIRMKRGGKL